MPAWGPTEIAAAVATLLRVILFNSTLMAHLFTPVALLYFLTPYCEHDVVTVLEYGRVLGEADIQRFATEVVSSHGRCIFVSCRACISTALSRDDLVVPQGTNLPLPRSLLRTVYFENWIMTISAPATRRRLLSNFHFCP